MSLAASAVSLDNAYAVFAILASAVVVLGGLVAIVRAIWKVAQTLRDNTKATQQLTGRLDDLTATMDGRYDDLSKRVILLEAAAAQKITSQTGQ